MRNPMNAAIVDRDLKPHRAASPAPKVLLYSHDTFGLGNIRRTLLLAEALGQAYPSASLLIVTGSPMIHAFRIPPRTDYNKLPCLTRSDADRYEPTYLSTERAEVADMRRGVPCWVRGSNFMRIGVVFLMVRAPPRRILHAMC